MKAKRNKTVFERFFHSQTAGSIVLLLATITAVVWANSPWAESYQHMLHLKAGVSWGGHSFALTLHHWVNDGLMAIFFLLVGLEVKRELLEGHLSSINQVILPGVAALGGMVVPALIYVMFNHGNSTALNGWAIPTATDIAFALGILSLLGNRVPSSLKVFLMALAIIDDLGAIVIIAIFYTSKLCKLSIFIAGIALLALIGFNLFGVVKKRLYFIVGAVLWFSCISL